MNWCYFDFSTAIERRDISLFVGIPPLGFVDFHLYIEISLLSIQKK